MKYSSLEIKALSFLIINPLKILVNEIKFIYI